MADNRRSRLIRRRQLQSAPVARPRRRRIEFFFDHRLMKRIPAAWAALFNLFDGRECVLKDVLKVG